MKRLSVPQREAIRHFAHDSKSGPRATGISTRTIVALFKRGLIEQIPGMPAGRYQLTRRGGREYDRLMASGDGPERLKAMFNG